MNKPRRPTENEYFLLGLPLLRRLWEELNVPEIYREQGGGFSFFVTLSSRLTRLEYYRENPVKAGEINLFSLLNFIYRHLISVYGGFENTDVSSEKLKRSLSEFVSFYSGTPFLDFGMTVPLFLKNISDNKEKILPLLIDLVILYLSDINPAVAKLKPLFDPEELRKKSDMEKVLNLLLRELEGTTLPGVNNSLKEFLLLPIRLNPDSLYAQLLFLLKNYGFLMPEEILSEALHAIDIYKEETVLRGIGGGETKLPEVSCDLYPEPERFSPDKGWMINVVLIAKMVYVWLYQLSRKYKREISTLDQIPDEELEQLAMWGINAIWLIGVWKRSPASQKIKHLAGNTDAAASAYSLYNYEIAEDLGGEQALLNLKERAWKRGIRLASDMVPNHTGIYSEWILNHPDWFIQIDEPPYPDYRFSGEDLSFSPEISIFIEDGYWTKTNAAVVFKYVDNKTGRTRYIYHGNDGTSTPWNDTAQLNYLIPEVRKAVMDTILKVARLFPIIRFDAAMTLTKRHYQRLWFPLPGHGGAIPSRSNFAMTKTEFDRLMPNEFWREVVDRVSEELPDTLLLAEAFWLMEGYFVRTLGMHRVYNSAFMNMIKMEENSKYRKTIKNIIEFDPEILKRFVNFMNNPDEQTAIEQFGKEKKYFGAAIMLVTMPGLPMFGHGQIEGFREKYGMEYRRCYWEEEPDCGLIKEHERQIFPLLKKRYLFSGSENFTLYDFYTGDHIDENVFVYSNMFGEERAVVIYHNKFGTTKGWFNISTPFLIKSEKSLFRKRLAESLKLKNDINCYYIFRDHRDNLFYIRNSRKIWEKGLYAELDAYDYHVFLDFVEVYDDEEGNWKVVDDALNGRGVPDIWEEYKKTRYRELLNLIEKQINILFEEIKKLLGEKTKGVINLPDINEGFRNIAELAAKKGVATKSEYKNITTLLINLIYKKKKFILQLLSDVEKASLLTALVLLFDFFTEIKLNIKEDLLGLLNCVVRLKPDMVLKDFLFFQEYSKIMDVESDEKFTEELVSLLKNEKTKGFLELNLYNDTLWFRKERFEELLLLLFIKNITEKTTPSKKSASLIKVAEKRVTKLITAAVKANYQYVKTLSLLIGN